MLKKFETNSSRLLPETTFFLSFNQQRLTITLFWRLRPGFFNVELLIRGDVFELLLRPRWPVDFQRNFAFVAESEVNPQIASGGIAHGVSHVCNLSPMCRVANNFGAQR